MKALRKKVWEFMKNIRVILEESTKNWKDIAPET